MLRLGSRKLAESLKRLWPHLVAELIKVFEQTQNNHAQGLSNS